MSFTYDPATPDDVTRVRFHTGQTVEGESFVSDEEINFLISEKGSYQAAVIAVIQLILMKLSKPDFKADWLSVSAADAIKSWRSMLVEKRQEFGIPTFTARATHVYRADSLQREEPDYSES